MTMAASTPDKQLQSLFSRMSETGREALLEYAVFLQARHPLPAEISQAPLQIERPSEESVVAAIKRLSATYPMLDRQALLHETSAFMMQHVVQGKAATEVIDELESYFSKQYRQQAQRNNADNT